MDKNSKIELPDLTFTIPVRYDSVSRIRNIVTTLSYLTGNFNTHILITEEDSARKIHPYIARFLDDRVRYLFIETESDLFHRTRLLNIMAEQSDTFCIVNYDADVILPLNQYVEAFNRIMKNELDLCSPFSLCTLHVPESLMEKLADEKDIRCLDLDRCYCLNSTRVAFGGAVFWNREKFMECGRENEHFISYGPEDHERIIRAAKLGCRWGRVEGPLFHLEHDRTANNWITHRFFERNNREFEKIQQMSPQELREYVRTWEWVQ